MSSISTTVPRLRSVLFVPGHRRDFLDKIAKTGADGIILDLEDGVPSERRDEARETTARWIAEPRPHGPTICVRVNALDQGCLEEDLAVAVAAHVTAIQISKVRSKDDVAQVERAVARHEARVGLQQAIRLWPLLETPQAVHGAYDIATSSKRVAYMGVGGGANGDLARAMGFQFRGDFLETLYVRSKVLLDARAAGVPNPIAGAVTSVGDTELIERYAQLAHSIGYEGMAAIHPSQVTIANAVFGPSEKQIASAQSMIVALEKAEKEGKGAILHEGKMVDAAHLQTARKLLAEAEEFEKRRLAAARA